MCCVVGLACACVIALRCLFWCCAAVCKRCCDVAVLLLWCGDGVVMLRCGVVL